VPACGGSTGPSLPGTAANLAELEQRLGTLRTTLGIPGLGVGIAEGDRIVWTRGIGFADLESQKPAAAETEFHIASLTKGFAGVVLVKLVSQGLVSLDDPVSKYGVNVAGASQIKVRHLANMTSEGTPGRAFAYNGDRFGLLQTVIESASGKPFGEILAQQVLAPLALTGTAPNVASTSFAFAGLDRNSFLANLATGYTRNGSSFTRTVYPTHFGPAAGIISTVGDMLKFSMALDTNGLLTASERSVLFEPAQSTSGGTLPYAIGWFSQDIRGTRIEWSYGYWIANSALIIRVPSRRLTFVALANSDRLSADFPLGAGKLESSPVAQEFLEAFVFGAGVLQ
jgi:CubicO group peptidase (beta-lactamase class C family)